MNILSKFIYQVIRYFQPLFVAPVVGAIGGASGGGAAATSASSGVGAAATSGGMGIISSIINQGANKKKQERQQKFTRENMELQQQYNKEMADYNNAINIANWKLQNEREDYLLRNGKAIETQALIDAGFNPALANGVSQPMPTGSIGASAQSAGGAPMGAAGAPSAIDPNIGANAVGAYMQAQQQQANLALANAQVKLMGTQADKNVAETQGQEQRNSYFGAIMPDKIGADKVALEKARLLDGMFVEDPEALQAIKDEQKVRNNLMNQNVSYLASQIAYLSKLGNKVDSDVKLNLAKEILTRAQTTLTSSQVGLIRSEEFKNNWSNPNWLINQQYRVANSKFLNADEKKQQLAILKDCYDEISGKQYQLRAQNFESSENNLNRIHDTKMQESAQGFQAQVVGMQMDEQIREYNINSVIRVFEDVENVVVPWMEKSHFESNRQQFEFEYQSRQFEHDVQRQSRQFGHDEQMQNQRFDHDVSMQNDRQSWENTRDIVRHGWSVEDDARRHDYVETHEYYDHNGTYTGSHHKKYHKK